MNKINKNDCKDRRAYKLQCRNLPYGIFNASDNGFIGIREKFGRFYLFTEYHIDTGEPFNTVVAQEDLGIDLPANIILDEMIQYIDQTTGRPIEWSIDIISPHKFKNTTRRGWWRYVDTKEICPATSEPKFIDNIELFNFLKQLELDRDGDIRWKRIAERWDTSDEDPLQDE